MTQDIIKVLEQDRNFWRADKRKKVLKHFLEGKDVEETVKVMKSQLVSMKTFLMRFWSILIYSISIEMVEIHYLVVIHILMKHQSQHFLNVIQ